MTLQITNYIGGWRVGAIDGVFGDFLVVLVNITSLTVKDEAEWSSDRKLFWSENR